MELRMKTSMAIGSLLIASCGSYGDKEQAPEAILTVNQTEVSVGDAIELDASQSVGDQISWTMNGTPLTVCGNLSICTLVMNEKVHMKFL